MSTTHKKIIINDPIYGTILVQDPLLQELIQSSFFQRLRRIQQMSVAHLTFPGAMHTRLQHSLGAYHLMTMALQQLETKGVAISPEETQAAQIAILLHDIGHGPFSHTLEGTILEHVNHEDLSLAMMNVLNKTFQNKLSLAIRIFKGTYERKFFHQLVSSQLDVDRLDYLTRDSFYSGVAEGVIGYDRIINMMNVHDNELVIQQKGVYSIEQFLISRRTMYWQVYYHKTVWATEQLIQNILIRAKELYLQSFFLPHQFETLFFFLKNPFDVKSPAHLEIFNRIDDADILHLIKFGQQSTDKIFSLLCDAYLNRKLYRVKVSTHKTEQLEVTNISKNIQAQLQLSNQELKYFVFEKQIDNTIYDNSDGRAIYILNDNNEKTDIANIHSILIQSAMLTPNSKCYQGFWRLP